MEDTVISHRATIDIAFKDILYEVKIKKKDEDEDDLNNS
jgi:hypothetical protein